MKRSVWCGVWLYRIYLIPDFKFIMIYQNNEHKFMIRKEYLNENDDNFKNQLMGSNNYGRYDKNRIKRLEDDQFQKLQKQKQQEELFDAIQPVKIYKFRDDVKRHHKQWIQHQFEQNKIFQSITEDALKTNKFQINTGNKVRKKVYVDDEKSKNIKKYAKPVINLKMDTEIECGLAPEKFEIEKIYNIFPFKKESIEISPVAQCNPLFEFDFNNIDVEKSRDLIIRLYNISEDGLPSEFKNQLKRIAYHLTFFDYTNFVQDFTSHIVNGKIVPLTKKDDKYQSYPKILLTIAANTLPPDQYSDDEGRGKEEIKIESIQTYHRIFTCSPQELAIPEESIYFSSSKQYELFKKHKYIEFQELKIYDQDVVVNTQVHRIILSQKVYLINIQEEIKLLIQLSEINKEDYLMNKIHSDLVDKIDQYIRLICSYTQSDIVTKYNIDKPYEKIYEFMYKSIMYNKPYIYEQIPKQLFARFPVLEIWYDLPENLHGYPRQTLHNSLYTLIKATITYEKKIKQYKYYESLKQKNYWRKYEPTDTNLATLANNNKKPTNDKKKRR